MKHKPLISVIVPAHNSGDTLCTCVESILASDFESFELLIVDDGSNDDTAEIIAEYREMDTRVHSARTEGEGLSAARNRGLDNAIGEWITFVDSDHYIEPGFLRRLYDKTDAETLLSVGSYTSELPGGERQRFNLYSDDTEGETRMDQENLLARCDIHALTHSWGKLFRRDIIEAAMLRFPAGMKFGEDTAFVFSYLRYIATSSASGNGNTECVATVNDCGYHYDKTRVTATASPREWITALKSFYEEAKGTLGDKPAARKSQLALARRNIDIYFIESILNALNLDREHKELSPKERSECYELIYLLVSPEVAGPRMPWFFGTFGSFKMWRLYDRFYKLIYRQR